MVEKLIHLSRCADTSIKKKSTKKSYFCGFLCFGCLPWGCLCFSGLCHGRLRRGCPFWGHICSGCLCCGHISHDCCCCYQHHRHHHQTRSLNSTLFRIQEMARLAGNMGTCPYDSHVFLHPPLFQPYSHSHLVFLQVWGWQQHTKRPSAPPPQKYIYI